MRRGLRLFGHPVHAMLVHFPLALLGTSLLWDAIALLSGDVTFWAVSFWCVVAGLVGSVPAAVTGFADYAALEKDGSVEATATRHMMLMLAAVSAYVVSAIVRRGPSPPAGGLLVTALALEAIGALLLVWAAHHGGSLVFGLGVGREEPSPNAGSGFERQGQSRGE